MQNWPYFIGIAIGLYMIWGAVAKTDTKPYYWLHKRAEVLFNDLSARILLSFSGGMVVGAMIYFIGF